MARRLAARFIVCFIFIESLFLHLGRLHGLLAMAASRCLFLAKKNALGFYLRHGSRELHFIFYKSTREQKKIRSVLNVIV